ncbi:MAG TPA: glycosyltransferase, partial [Kiritimatiellia bacterium]|nr:glycosyltransferase [Kiritimatiellia bacterium]
MTTDQTPLDFSIVIPVYFNEGSLSATMDKIKSEVLARHAWNCEVIYVDDGSGDGSLNELLGMCRANPGLVKVVKF